jgi:hypothetical protein
MHARLTGQSSQPVTALITGGDAKILAGSLSAFALPGIVKINEYLVLEGLLWVARDLGVPVA